MQKYFLSSNQMKNFIHKFAILIILKRHMLKIILDKVNSTLVRYNSL